MGQPCGLEEFKKNIINKIKKQTKHNELIYQVLVQDQAVDLEVDLEQDLEVDLKLGLDLEVVVGQVKKIQGQSELCQEKIVSSHLFTKENTTMNVLQRTLEPFPGVPHL